MGFQEAASDIVALLSTLHFKSVVDHILAETRGNIYAPNELNWFAELSPTHQIRSASNSIRMGDVPDVRIPFERLSEPDRHLLSQPLTGAVFDILVELFQTILVQRGLIREELNAKYPPRRPGYRRRGGNAFQELFNEAFRDHGPDFAQALVRCAYIAGSLWAVAFTQLRPDLTYSRFHEALPRADRIVTKGRFRDLISDSLDWRGISVPAREAKRPVRRDFARRSIVTKKIETIGLMRRL